MSSVSSIRLSGLASGIDTDEMIKAMLTADQEKIDKVGQKQQTITWQQEIYREVISEATSINEKYFSITSKDSIISSDVWNTLSINSKDESVITASAKAGASKINYSFDVKSLAQPAKVSYDVSDKNKTLKELDSLFIAKSFKIEIEDGKKSETITLSEDDTIDSVIKKINDSMSGDVKASYSEMTGKFTIETKRTGKSAQLNFIPITIDINGVETEKDKSLSVIGSNSQIIVKGDGFEKIISQESNSFTIDSITYNVNGIGESKITSKQDYQKVVDNINTFIEDYNKLMDKIYDLVTQKTNSAYPPLTDDQKEDMSEEEIEKWEKKAKQGILRNDSEMRRFMENMQTSIFGEKMDILNEMGLKSHENYNKKGQISLDTQKFIKALEDNSSNVYKNFAGDKNSVLENIKGIMKSYVGGSSSVFAQKAGLEKTASFTNNYYSTQLKAQADLIKLLQNKFDDKETSLYAKFATLESSMNKLNNQMNYFNQS